MEKSHVPEVWRGSGEKRVLCNRFTWSVRHEEDMLNFCKEVV